MSGGQPADEVAEDYKASLEYLTNNDRYAINNFTVIAKENTENADAISNVLIEHIGKARPDHKLPALYVLDSIAKNIGTPYSLFLGHKLYGTFMDAYSKVDRPTRKKLDEMLKTWKSPVPGSIDSRPVFPVEITKKIENALIQAKTRAIQIEQEQQRAQMELLQRRAPATTTPTTQWRNTPTPPQNASRYPPPISQGYLPMGNGQPQGNANTQYPQFHQQPSSSISQYQQTPQLGNLYPPHQPNPMLETLHRDVEGLIQDAKQELVRNVYDSSVQGRLNALLQLQQALKQQQLRPEQLQAVRDQVRALQVQAAQRPPPGAQMPVPVPTPTPVVPLPQPVGFTTPSHTPYAPPAPANEPPSTNLLANLLASVERSKQVQTNSTYQNPTQVPRPQPIVQPPSVANGNENPLIAQLRASGLLSASGTPSHTLLSPALPRPASQIPQPPVVTPSTSLNLSDLLRVASLPKKQNDIDLTPASLKMPRPHLILNLYDAQPKQCLTCGKRFPDTDEGRNKKARHLDWHFRTNKRIADSAPRGQSRSWYVDELEWIRFREDEGDGVDGSSSGGKDARALAADAAKNDPKNKFIPAPSDSALASMPCAICQEKFEMSWKEELQDFVWMDAIKIGGRVYHASCYADYKKDEDSTPARLATPDSVLGKRKAESESMNPSPAKMPKGVAAEV